MKDIVIVGSGGSGREVADTIRAINKAAPQYNIVGFIDDNPELLNKTINDIKVIGSVDDLVNSFANKKVSAVISIADASAKKSIVAKLNDCVEWENIIHPTACISSYADIGTGNIIQAFTIIGPNAKVGSHCLINNYSELAHDVVAGNYVSIMNHCDICGGVILMDEVYLGTAVKVIPGKTIGWGANACAGSVVFTDVQDNVTIMGNPARAIK